MVGNKCDLKKKRGWCEMQKKKPKIPKTQNDGRNFGWSPSILFFLVSFDLFIN
jgi:hypothetical protein